MRAWLSVALLVFIVSGCALVDSRMASWQGHHFSDVVAAWGPPQTVVEDGNGGQIMSWASTRTYASPGQAYGYANQVIYHPPQYRTTTATRTFWVNPEGVIYRWAWRGL